MGCVPKIYKYASSKFDHDVILFFTDSGFELSGPANLLPHIFTQLTGPVPAISWAAHQARSVHISPKRDFKASCRTALQQGF